MYRVNAAREISKELERRERLFRWQGVFDSLIEMSKWAAGIAVFFALIVLWMAL